MILLRQLFCFLLAFAVLSGCGQSKARKQNVIALSDIELMFNNMRHEAKWNVDGEMLWGYFFFDRSPERLNRLGEELKKTGYQLVDVHQTDDKSFYVLHVEKVETHSPASLDKRNQELTALAEKYGVETYDGMDVGPVLVTKK